jgi:hypothetical protein
MIGTKAIAAIALTGLGGLTTGTAAYLEARPRAFSHAEMGQSAEVSHPAPIPLSNQTAVIDDRDSDVLMLEPVVITSRPRHRERVVTASVKSEPENAACSDWQALATGPAGRRVRLLCQH